MMLVAYGDGGGGGVGMVGVLVRVGVCIRSVILMGVGVSCCCVAERSPAAQQERDPTAQQEHA